MMAKPRQEGTDESLRSVLPLKTGLILKWYQAVQSLVVILMWLLSHP